MVVGLVSEEEERRICEKLLEYYSRLYAQEGVTFKKQEKILTKKEIGELYYTYPGEEELSSEQEKLKMINEAINSHYGTPLVLLQKGKKLIIIDGHRRARIAWQHGMNWRAFIISPGRDMKFGVEKIIKGTIKKLFKPGKKPDKNQSTFFGKSPARLTMA